MNDPHVDSNGDEEFILAEIDQPVHRRGALSIAWSVIVVI